MAISVCSHGQTWISAFEAFHEEISTYYAYTQWKAIDWNAMHTEYHPRITLAGAENDTFAFYLALREYVYMIPDVHVTIVAAGEKGICIEERLKYEHIGGGYGFALIGLDDGRVVVRLVTENSSAAQAGIEVGAEILTFNGLPIETALQQVSTLWSEVPPATKEVERIQQCRHIGRAPVNTTVSLSFKNPGDSNTTTAQLTAIDDDYETLTLTLDMGEDLPDLSHEIMENNFGYIRITTCANTQQQAGRLKVDFSEAVQTFVYGDIPGVIIDIRKNSGGLDAVAAALPGHFFTERTHYEYVSFYNSETGAFEIDPMLTLYTDPILPYYGRPIVVLVSYLTASSGEGIALALQKLERARIIGFYGTYGSFGVTGGMVNLPCGFTVMYPHGRSLNVNEEIQVESDANLEGGVVPDIRPPLNDETIRSLYIDSVDVELECAIQYLHTVNVEYGNEVNVIPTSSVLYQNYPNPFNTTTDIRYHISNETSNQHYTLRIYNLLGQEIKTLVNELKEPGFHTVTWDGKDNLGDDVSTGLYFYLLSVGDLIAMKRMVLLK